MKCQPEGLGGPSLYNYVKYIGDKYSSIYNFTDPREDRKVTWTEGPGLHHSWETQDGQQAVQLPHEDVQ